MSNTLTDTKELPGHEQAAAFWVGALIATEAVAVYIEPAKAGGPFDVPYDFNRLPPRLKVSILKACEEEFKRWRETIISERLAAKDQTVSDLRE